MSRTHVLFVAGHKGGSGRTTTALALAVTWARSGARVGVFDADPSGTARQAAGSGDWPGVEALGEMGQSKGYDVVVLDGPSLADQASRPLLARADGVLLACPAEVIALRTLPGATRALASAAQRHRGLEFHGLLLTRYRGDAIQRRLREELARMDGDLLFSTGVPEDEVFRGWPGRPGEPLPVGPAAAAYAAVAEELAERLGLFSVAAR